MSGPSRIALQAARTRAIPQKAAEWRNHIILRGVAKTTTPKDVGRALTRAKCQGVRDVIFEYKQFMRDGVVIELAHPDFTQPNIDKLKGLSIGGIPVKAFPWEVRNVPESFDGKRMRGKAGRQEAINRGINKPSGDGPHAGMGGWGMNVVISGFPFEFRMAQLVEMLNGYDLRGKEQNRTAVHWAQRHSGDFSPYRTAVVRAASVSEAHRLVRDFHGTPFPWSEKSPIKYTLKAHIIH